MTWLKLAGRRSEELVGRFEGSLMSGAGIGRGGGQG